MAQYVVAGLGLLRQLVGADLQRERRAVADEDLAVTVEDLAPGCLDRDLTGAVVLGLGQVLVAGEHLDVPEAEEDHGEGNERDAADHGDANRELRVHRALFLGSEHQPAVLRMPRRLRRRRAGTGRPRIIDQRRPQRAADQREEWEREDQAEDALDDDLADDEEADRCVDAEHQLDRSVGGGDDEAKRAGQQRRYPEADDVVGLAPAAGEVAAGHQRQRPDAERAAEDRVEQDAGGEAGGGAGDGAASRPSAITVTATRLAVEPSSGICENRPICTSTAPKTSAMTIATMRGVKIIRRLR